MKLHIMRDNFFSKRFIDFLDANFPAEDHRFIITAEADELRFVDAAADPRIDVLHIGRKMARLGYLNDRRLKDLVGGCTHLYAHFMTNWCAYIILRYAGNNQIITWMPWGGDIYDLIGLDLTSPETDRILPAGFKRRRDGMARKKKIIYDQAVKMAIARVDFIAVDFRSEYDLIREHCRIRAEYRSFFYPNPVDFLRLDRLPPKSATEISALQKLAGFEKLILAGNSGYPSNNHIDILKMLSGMQDADFGVVCPLSYGPKDYIASVARAGAELLGGRFLPLTDYIDPDQYFQVLSCIDTVIMNHCRQQGKGNVIPSIYLGKKVFLREMTTTYREYEAIGIAIGSTDRLLAGERSGMLEPWTEEIRQANRKIISERYDPAKARKNIKAIFID